MPGEVGWAVAVLPSRGGVNGGCPSDEYFDLTGMEVIFTRIETFPLCIPFKPGGRSDAKHNYMAVCLHHSEVESRSHKAPAWESTPTLASFAPT
jgi:hypothetical protein